MCCFMLTGSNQLCECGGKKSENAAFLLQKCKKNEDEIQDQVSFGGFPATCAILLLTLIRN